MLDGVVDDKSDGRHAVVRRHGARVLACRLRRLPRGGVRQGGSQAERGVLLRPDGRRRLHAARGGRAGGAHGLPRRGARLHL